MVIIQPAPPTTPCVTIQHNKALTERRTNTSTEVKYSINTLIYIERGPQKPRKAGVAVIKNQYRIEVGRSKSDIMIAAGTLYGHEYNKQQQRTHRSNAIVTPDYARLAVSLET